MYQIQGNTNHVEQIKNDAQKEVIEIDDEM